MGAAARRGRNQPDRAVGKNAIHVEEDDLDAASAFMRGQCHALILDGTGCGVNPRAWKYGWNPTRSRTTFTRLGGLLLRRALHGLYRGLPSETRTLLRIRMPPLSLRARECPRGKRASGSAARPD